MTETQPTKLCPKQTHSKPSTGTQEFGVCFTSKRGECDDTNCSSHINTIQDVKYRCVKCSRPYTGKVTDTDRICGIDGGRLERTF